MTSGMTQSSMSPVRNLQCQQSTPLLDPPSWHTSNCDINTKFSGYLPWGKRTSEMTSGMTLSSMSQVRNPQHPPSTPLLDLPLLGTLLIEISTQNFQGMLQSNFCPLPLPPSHNTPSHRALTPTQIYLKTKFRVAHSTLPQGNCFVICIY